MDCLVIEDDADTANLICNALLRETGHAAVASFKALDALRLVQDKIWDVVILDRLLPGSIDGLYVSAVPALLSLPLDIVLHTPGGLVLAALQIARAIRDHKAKVTVFVPHYASRAAR
jgi:CheY-like chemotaxis protein